MNERQEATVATKFTPEQLANMSALFGGNATDTTFILANLKDESRRAGVVGIALAGGLTMEQWKIVRDPTRIIREAILALGESA